LHIFAKTWGRVRHRFCTAGSQGVLDPLAPFLRHFLRRAKKWHQKPAQRGAQLDGVEVGCTRVRRRKQKFTPRCAYSTKKTPLFCRFRRFFFLTKNIENIIDFIKKM
jgi:hypothetical protein